MIDKYSCRVIWSEADNEFVGLCTEFPGISWLATIHETALTGVRKVVKSVIRDLKKSNEKIPEPLSIKSYSGKLMLRIRPETHWQLVIQAAETGVSLNRFITSRLI